MKTRYIFYIKVITSGVLALTLLSACNPQATPAPITPEKTSSPLDFSTPTEPEIQPTASATPTSVPLAATVNGEGISLVEYQLELELFKAAKGADLGEDDKTRVLDSLIEQTLLAKAALENGYDLDEASLEIRVQQLADQMGGQSALEEWIQVQGYTPELFRQALTRSLLAAWMRDQITAAVPLEAEQIYARQILVYTKEEADQIYTQLQAGNDFENLAIQYNPLTGGILLWFPRGYLPDPELEEAIFSLQPGEYTPVIETLAGFHIVQVIERETAHPLEADALHVLQAKALQDWLKKQRSESDIQILLP